MAIPTDTRIAATSYIQIGLVCTLIGGSVWVTKEIGAVREHVFPILAKVDTQLSNIGSQLVSIDRAFDKLGNETARRSEALEARSLDNSRRRDLIEARRRGGDK